MANRGVLRLRGLLFVSVKGLIVIATALIISISLRMVLLPLILPAKVIDEGHAPSSITVSADQSRGSAVAASYGFEPDNGLVSCWEFEVHSIDADAPTGYVLRWCSESNGNVFYSALEDENNFASGCVPDSNAYSGVPVNKLICSGYYRINLGPLRWIVGDSLRAFEVTMYNDGSYHFEAWSVGN